MTARIDRGVRRHGPTRRNRRSQFLPKHVSSCKGAALTGLPPRLPVRFQRSAGRWPPLRTRIRGSMVVLTHDDGSRTSLRTVDWTVRGTRGSSRGSTRPIQFWSGAASRRFRFLRLSFSSRSGGDEETRTPDPLLAKEMLCQLSYVPPPPEWMVGVSGLEPETSALSGQCSNQLS